MWEAGLLKILSSSKQDTINFKSINFSGLGMVTGVASDNRLLFMPHSEGIYMALVLKNAEDLEKEQDDQLEMMSHISSQHSDCASPTISNNLIYDVSSTTSSGKPKPPV